MCLPILPNQSDKAVDLVFYSDCHKIINNNKNSKTKLTPSSISWRNRQKRQSLGPNKCSIVSALTQHD
jgi:hypothetical protein